jgi:hypothetical protein
MADRRALFSLSAALVGNIHADDYEIVLDNASTPDAAGALRAIESQL